MLLSTDKVPTGSCLSEAVLKLVIVSPITYGLGVFQSVLFFVLNLRKIEFSYKPF